jgi:hypothetical protein
LLVIVSKLRLRREEPAPSEAEGIWASRAMWRFAFIKKSRANNHRAFGSLPYQTAPLPIPPIGFFSWTFVRICAKI